MHGRPNDVRGFIHKKIGRFVGTAFGGVSKFLPGPIGTIVGGVGGVIRQISTGRAGGGLRQLNQSQILAIFQSSSPSSRARQIDAYARQGFDVRGYTAQGGTPGAVRLPQSDQMRDPVTQQLLAQLQPSAGQCPKGFHVNRSAYCLKNGERVEKGERCVRNRSRNNDNGRAAMRAARRLIGRKKHQDRIDKALRGLAPRRGGRRSAAPPRAGGPIVVAS